MNEQNANSVVELLEQIAYNVHHMKRIVNAVTIKKLDKNNRDIVIETELGRAQDDALFEALSNGKWATDN